VTTWHLRPGDTPGPWDSEKAASLLGNTLLAGLSFFTPSGELCERQEVFGIVRRATLEDGIVLQLRSGEEFSLPPQLEAISPAERGVYTLKSTGEAINDPDFLATWSITRPDA